MKLGFCLSARLNLIWHCGAFGTVKALSPGWQVTNPLIPTRRFNFETGLEDLPLEELQNRVQESLMPSGRALLWSRAKDPPIPVVHWSLASAYEVMAFDAENGRGSVDESLRVMVPPQRPDHNAVSLMTAAHEEPRTKPYFERLAGDSNVVWILSPFGGCILRRNFGLLGLYELAILPDHRAQGIGSHLVKAAVNFAVITGLPLIAHAQPNSSAFQLFRSSGFNLVFRDKFLVASDFEGPQNSRS